MAKKKKSYRRRRVGAMSLNAKSPVVIVGSAVAGYLLADKINEAVDKALIKVMPDKTTPTVLSSTGKTVATVGSLALGAVLIKMGKPNLIKTVVGGIIAGAGVKRAAKSAGLIKGYQNVPVIGRRAAGYQAVPVLGGTKMAAYELPNAINAYIPAGSSKVLGRSGVGYLG